MKLLIVTYIKQFKTDEDCESYLNKKVPWKVSEILSQKSEILNGTTPAVTFHDDLTNETFTYHIENLDD